MKNICEWKQTYIFPDYYKVSNAGLVMSVRTEKILKPNMDKDGYLYVVLCVKGEKKSIKVHRLVAKAFLENPLNKPTVNHKNGKRNDNRVENLEWATHKKGVAKYIRNTLIGLYESI